MSKRIVSVLLTVVLMVTFAFSTAISANAATGVRGTVTGIMQDTSDDSNGPLSWSFTYDTTRASASLTITGNGYMPNYTEDSWFEIQQEVQCYITQVTIGEGVKSIMENAFAYEINLTSITLPESLERIGDNAFAYTGIKSLHIPSKVEYLSGTMFFNSPIKNITVSENNPYYTSYDGDVYSKDMKTLVVSAPGKFVEDSYYNFKIPSSVNVIAPKAFYMSQIREIIIPSNVTEIRNMAFAGSAIEKVSIDAGLQMIYDSAFLSCDNLTEIALPSTITYLGWYSLGYGYQLDLEGIESFLDSAGVSHGVITPDNCQSYLEQIGYTAEQFIVITPNNDFSIYAILTSIGEEYAKENELTYCDVYTDCSRLYTAKIVSGGILLEWLPSADAMSYRVLRKTVYNTWEVVKTISAQEKCSYIDTNPIENYVNEYTIQPFSIIGNGYYDKDGLSCYYIKEPKLLSASTGANGITISWQAVNGAYNYCIYRKAKGETQWKPYATVSSSYTQFTDSDVLAGQTYSYTVSAKNSTAESTFSASGISKTFIIQPRIAVYNIAAGIAVRWEYSGSADSFKVYRKTASSGWSLIYTAKGNERVFVDKNLSYGTEYLYKVDVVSGNSQSNASQPGGAVIAMQSPMKFTVENRVSGIQVKWSMCAGATGYYVYRRTVSSGWLRIAVINDANQSSFLDTNTKSGTTYIYTVKSFNGKYMSTYNTNGRRTIFLKTPKANNVKSTNKGMQVKYTASPNAQGYYVYRKTPTSTWKLVGTVKNGKTTTFYDTTSKKGQTYTYTVRAYKNGVRSSYYSYGYKVKDVH